MYDRTADPIYGPLICGRYIRLEFADRDGSNSAWAYGLGCLDAPDYIPLGGVAENIYGACRDADQLRANRESGLRFPFRATAAEQETYRLHCELRAVTEQRDALLAAAKVLLRSFGYAPGNGPGWYEATRNAAAITSVTGGQA